MAKLYANALERMQYALKRETHDKLVKQMNERSRISVRVTKLLAQNAANHIDKFQISNFQKNGFIGKLQSQVHRTGLNEASDVMNIPMSWKWESLGGLNERKERKGKRNRSIKTNKNSS